jgi:murein DD-endopeptidase MepM/ murein hydrolase activator NlpD
MKTKIIIASLVSILLGTVAFAQKDSLRLSCPMFDAVMKTQKGSYKFNQPDMKVVIVSSTDTAARASIGGRISNVTLNDEGTYDVVIYYRDFYMWYTGITKPLVRKGEVVKLGQVLGLIKPGNELEFLLFKNQEPLDPRKFLDCKVQ